MEPGDSAFRQPERVCAAHWLNANRRLRVFLMPDVIGVPSGEKTPQRLDPEQVFIQYFETMLPLLSPCGRARIVDAVNKQPL